MAGEDLGEENYKAGLGIPSCLYAKNKLAFYVTSAFPILGGMIHAVSSSNLCFYIFKNPTSYPTTMTMEECFS